MTAREFKRLYIQARKKWPIYTNTTMKQLRKAYQQAGENVAKILREAILSGKSSITINELSQIDASLAASVADIQDKIDRGIKSMISGSSSEYAKINKEYLRETFERAGVAESVTAGIEAIYEGVNRKVMYSLITRIWRNGYSFSDNVWQAASSAQKSIKEIIAEGIARNRDVLKIAKDIQVYTKDGKVALMKRYGELERGTAEFSKRIPANIDYRALRLVRTELTSSLREATIMQARSNPGTDGLFDWVRANEIDWGCECPDFAAKGPYKLEEIPATPHANCHPAGTIILTVKGKIPIEDILPGDIVVSHDGSLQYVTNSWRTFYTGDILTLKTDDGVIRATPEHPLFSDGIWKIAQDLKIGDNLMSINVDVKSFSKIKSIAGNSPADRFKKCSFFRILTLLSRCRVPIPAIDFNGQLYIFKSKIDSISSYDKVRERLFTNSDQGIIQHMFIGRPKVSGIELRSAGFLFVRHCSTPDCIVCGSSIRLPTIRVTSDMSFSDSRKLKTKQKKIPTDATSGNTKTMSYFVDREVLIPEQLDENRFFKIDSFTHNSTIVNVLSKKFKGTVYNLSVRNTHSFIANGFASHNCMCSIRPHLRDQTEFVADLKTWAKGGSVDYMDDWYNKVYIPGQNG